MVSKVFNVSSSINVRLPQELQMFVKVQTDGAGVYDSTSEYIRDLIRRDYQRAEEQKWQKLEALLQPGLDGDEENFLSVSRGDVIEAAKARLNDG